MSRDILSGLPDATRGEIISFMTFFKGERARTLEALDGDFEDCLEDRIRGVDPPFSLEDVTSAVDHLQVMVCVEFMARSCGIVASTSTPSTRRLLDGSRHTG